MNTKNENAVVFCCDESHLPMAYFVANQIHEVEKDRKFDIIICVPSEVPVPNYIDPHVAKIVRLDVAELAGITLQRKWISTATFYRILLPTVFHGTYQKLLYLDTDVYLRRPGIQSLFNEVKINTPLAACLEPSQYVLRRQDKAQQTTKKRIALLGGRDKTYFNAGLLLIEPEAFLKMDGINRFWRAYEENIDVISEFGEQDQGALNKAFADEIFQISPLFNWHTGALANETMVQYFNPV
ncbi:glycosyltransferase family 8 protein, partial [Yoonia sp.]|uniref:glycosyltransferase family 8 protein n=1 Tax=Yoonia sp. TaxID=2212373 RepID=UPI002DF7D861|nr:glycosyltransferase [Yoonia sp.]